MLEWLANPVFIMPIIIVYLIGRRFDDLEKVNEERFNRLENRQETLLSKINSLKDDTTDSLSGAKERLLYKNSMNNFDELIDEIKEMKDW